MDLVVGGLVVVEVKAVEKLAPVHEAQLVTYLKLSGYQLGLLINFNVVLLKYGIRRRVNSHRTSDQPSLRLCVEREAATPPD